MKTGCMLFDLDGTLLNTNDLVIESLQYTIRRHLGCEIEACRLYKYFGQPLVDIMADLNPGQAEQMVRTYREYSALKHDELTKVFPKVPETIRELKRHGVSVAVVTSKLKNLAYRGLELFDLQELFDACIAFEDTKKHKPAPDPVIKALDVLGVDPGSQRVIMVGDSPYDVLCANNAGVTSAVVEWSLHPREVLQTCNPRIWLKEFPALLNYV